MIFVKSDDLKPGMRLAKPIYNKSGVLLYDRNSSLTEPAIISVRNFGLIGVYILEPAEPLPPLSKEDLEFEQLQTIYMFQLRDCVGLILKGQSPEPLADLMNDIMRHYGSLNHRVNFNQNLRSGEDFIYKHALSTAILVTMMASRLKFSAEKKQTLVSAALLYDIGYQDVPLNIIEKGTDLSKEDQAVIQNALEHGLEKLTPFRNDFEFFPRALALMHAYVYMDHPEKLSMKPDEELLNMAAILRIAEQFDQLTAMNIGHEPVSELAAIRHLLDNPKQFQPWLISVLGECIHIVPHAASVDLSSGDKGVVLVENTRDFMKPVVLRLRDNKILDLSQKDVAAEVQVIDIMKTMDNRIVVDEETIKQFVPDEKLNELTKKFRNALSKYEQKQA